MNKATKQAVITVRASESLRNAAKAALAARGDSFQSFLERHLEMLVGGLPEAPLQSRRVVPLVGGLPRKMQPYLEMATEILSSGNAVAIDALTKNLEAFSELVRVTARDRKVRTPQP